MVEVDAYRVSAVRKEFARHGLQFANNSMDIIIDDAIHEKVYY